MAAQNCKNPSDTDEMHLTQYEMLLHCYVCMHQIPLCSVLRDRNLETLGDLSW